MRTRRIVHGLALALLAVVAMMALAGQGRDHIGSPTVSVFQLGIGIALWSFLLWRLWKRPQSWGLGIGIFLILMVVLQIYLWRQAMSSPNHGYLGIYFNVFHFVLYEAPIFVGAVCCILLRWCYPHAPSA